MAKRRYKKRKIDKQSMIIVIIFCLVIIILAILSTINKLKPKEENKEQQADLSASELKTDEDVFNKYNCELNDKKYEDNNFTVYASLEKDLYNEDNTSNKEYYDGLIRELSKQYQTDFILVDEDKQIRIEVYFDENGDYNYIINNIENYFENSEDDKKIRNFKEIETIEKEIVSSEANKFNQRNWSVLAAGVEIKDRDKEYLYYDNFKIRTDNFSIDKIIYDNNYQEEIIDGVKVGEDFNQIKEKLGEPTFETNNMLGYKSQDAYVFFYKDYAVLYPNEKYKDNNKLEEIITKFYNGEYEQRKFFAFSILQECKDFKSKLMDNNSLRIYSVNRGIEIIVDENNNAIVNIYNNYDMTETTKKYIREKKFTPRFEEDLIFKSENESIE